MTKAYTLEEGMAALQQQIPDVMTPFGSLVEAVTKDGVLSAKTKRLMMVSVAVALRCEHCIRVHVKAAVELQASRAEILEAVGVSILLAGGPAAAYGATLVQELLDEAGA